MLCFTLGPESRPRASAASLLCQCFFLLGLLSTTASLVALNTPGLSPTMSFQRFRISTTAAPAPTVQTMSSLGQAPAPPAGPSTGHFQGVSFRVQFRDELEAREGTGGGDGPLDDARRYTHRFAGLAAFQAWRAAEEAERTVEFVLSDRHTSKATPPRFKEHVKLVCGRHGKNGRKKYEKKFPGRKRKWESLKVCVPGTRAMAFTEEADPGSEAD